MFLSKSADWRLGLEAQPLCGQFPRCWKNKSACIWSSIWSFFFFGCWRGWSVLVHALVLSIWIILKHLRLITSSDTKKKGDHFPSNPKSQSTYPCRCPFGLEFLEPFLGRFSHPQFIGQYLINDGVGKANSTISRSFWLTVNHRSEGRRSRILKTFSSVLEHEDPPLCRSSSIDSLPYINALKITEKPGGLTKHSLHRSAKLTLTSSGSYWRHITYLFATLLSPPYQVLPDRTLRCQSY